MGDTHAKTDVIAVVSNVVVVAGSATHAAIDEEERTATKHTRIRIRYILVPSAMMFLLFVICIHASSPLPHISCHVLATIWAIKIALASNRCRVPNMLVIVAVLIRYLIAKPRILTSVLTSRRFLPFRLAG